MSEKPMNKEPDSPEEDLRSEYDFSKGVRGKYADRLEGGSNVVVLEPDVASRFKNAEAVNEALRKYLSGKKPKKASGA